MKINHKKILWIVIILLVIFGGIYFLSQNKQDTLMRCLTNSECAPAICCHPESCVPKKQAPYCKEIMCTSVCAGPLDCGAGYCGCVRGKCGIISNEN